jgi:hypothetical protein
LSHRIPLAHRAGVPSLVLASHAKCSAKSRQRCTQSLRFCQAIPSDGSAYCCLVAVGYACEIATAHDDAFACRACANREFSRMIESTHSFSRAPATLSTHRGLKRQLVHVFQAKPEHATTAAHLARPAMLIEYLQPCSKHASLLNHYKAVTRLSKPSLWQKTLTQAEPWPGKSCKKNSHGQSKSRLCS